MYKNICFDGVFQKQFHYTVRWKDIYNCNFLSNCKIVYCYRLHSYNSAVSLYHDNSVHFMFNVYLSETLWFFMTDNCSLTHKQNQFACLNVEKHYHEFIVLFSFLFFSNRFACPAGNTHHTSDSRKGLLWTSKKLNFPRHVSKCYIVTENSRICRKL